MGFLGSKRGDDCLQMRILIEGDCFWWWCCWKLSRMKGLTYENIYRFAYHIYIYLYNTYIYIYAEVYTSTRFLCTATIYQLDKNTRGMIPILTNYSTYLKKKSSGALWGPFSPRISGTWNGGFPQPYSRHILGVGKLPYISRTNTASVGEDSSILGTWNGWWLLGKYCSEKLQNIPKRTCVEQK